MTSAFKKIEDHSAEELNEVIQNAVIICAHAGFDFYKVLHGIDAYMERRDRKRKAQAYDGSRLMQQLKGSLCQDD